jgi:hypothetical protein
LRREHSAEAGKEQQVGVVFGQAFVERSKEAVSAGYAGKEQLGLKKRNIVVERDRAYGGR